MTMLERIMAAPDGARVSILYPAGQGSGESIGDVGELKREIDNYRLTGDPAKGLNVWASGPVPEGLEYWITK